MNNLYLQMGIGFAMPAAFCLILIPFIIKTSMKLKLADLPGERKVHTKPISRFGGIGIFVSAAAGISLSHSGLEAVRSWPVLFSSLGLVFSLGVWDDLRNISARMRFLIQIGCATALAATGLRLTSLYGIFGIHGLSVTGQYIVTVVVIVGTTNAYNLIDGVDGLAGGLSFIGLLVLAYVAYKLRLYPMVVVILAFAGALLGFLKNNVSPARIFMGDCGSLVLGYLMSAIGILLVQKANFEPQLMLPSKAAILVTAILVIPVFDTLRVFAFRIKNGKSPFKADKTHIHHLFLIAGLNHRRTSLFLYVFEILLVLLALFVSNSTGVSIVIVIMVILFHVITEILRINQQMERWLAVIKKMERE
jgi:UDP-GlcNAc:undecaprenyl-phosphate/decaprenyl-phosphate GlcNAc-1-phosphate transferase